jgi:hypothetical protein
MIPRSSRRTLALAIAAALLPAAAAAGHAQSARADSAAVLPVGSVAPDFSLSGATRYGTLRAPVRLSHFRGQTVVLAFFYKARTKG